MIKQFKPILFIGALLITFISSCKKEVVLEPSNESQFASNELKTLVKQVKVWRDSIVSYNATGSSENNIKSLSLSQNDIVPPVIEWDKAFKNYDTIGKKGISVPLSYDPNSGNYLQLVTSLVKNKITGFIVSTLPDSAYHEIHRNLFDFTNFTGSIIIYDITGKYLKQVNFKQGTPIKENSISTNKWGQVKTFEEEDLPEVVVIGHRKRSTSYLLIFLNSIKGTPNQEIDPNSESGGVNVGGIDQLNLLPIILNKIKNPCLSGILNKIIYEGLPDDLTQEINNVFGESKKINLIFNESSIIGKNAAASTPIYKEDGTIDCYINIDVSKFNKPVSEEFVVSTILHEISHCFIALNFSNKESYLNTDREKAILENYVTKMSSYLETNYNLQPKQSLSMILTGLYWLASGPGSKPEYELWNEETQSIYLKLVKDYGFQIDIMNDSNYLFQFNNEFSEGKSGTISCKF